MKYLILLLPLILLFLEACTTTEPRPVACPADSLLCPDGFVLGREGPNCEFPECPFPVVKECDYETDLDKNFLGKSPEECETINFLCVETHKRFSNACGCGCERIQDDRDRTFCPGERPDACIEIYKPACGWFDPERIQCAKEPCAQTYSNSCFACGDENVLYWTDGDCPE